MNRPLAILVLLLASSIRAEVMTDALVTGAYDGDTLSVEADIWPALVWVGSVRVLGMDTPEIRGQCEQEKARAILARDHVRTLLTDKTVRLTDVDNDKYGGRVVARVHLYDEDLGEWQGLADHMIELGLARAYDGGQRQGWCNVDEPLLVEPKEKDMTANNESPIPKFALDAWQDDRPGHVFLSVVLWGEGADYSDPPVDGFGITLTPSERDDLVQQLTNPEPR